MAFKGKAAKSSSGASMSKYDVEVEERLQALGKAHDNCNHDGGGDCAALEAKVDRLIEILNRILPLRVVVQEIDGVKRFV